MNFIKGLRPLHVGVRLGGLKLAWREIAPIKHCLPKLDCSLARLTQENFWNFQRSFVILDFPRNSNKDFPVLTVSTIFSALRHCARDRICAAQLSSRRRHKSNNFWREVYTVHNSAISPLLPPIFRHSLANTMSNKRNALKAKEKSCQRCHKGGRACDGHRPCLNCLTIGLADDCADVRPSTGPFHRHGMEFLLFNIAKELRGGRVLSAIPQRAKIRQRFVLFFPGGLFGRRRL